MASLLTTASLATLFLVPLLGWLPAGSNLHLASLLACVLMASRYISTLRFYGLSPFWALGVPLTGALYLSMTWSSALNYWRGAGSLWKGRVYHQ